MFIDALLLLSDAQAITADAVSTNSIDLSLPTPARDIGSGEAMDMVFAIDVSPDFTTGDETYDFQVITSEAGDLSAATVIASRKVTAAQLAAYGRIVRLGIPAGAILQRYLGAGYDVGGTTPLITVTAFVQPASMASLAFPTSHADAISIA